MWKKSYRWIYNTDEIVFFSISLECSLINTQKFTKSWDLTKREGGRIEVSSFANISRTMQFVGEKLAGIYFLWKVNVINFLSHVLHTQLYNLRKCSSRERLGERDWVTPLIFTGFKVSYQYPPGMMKHDFNKHFVPWGVTEGYRS